MDMHLSDTLELRYLLRQRFPDRAVKGAGLAMSVAEAFETFLVRLELGKNFFLRSEDDLNKGDHLTQLREALAAVCWTDPGRIKIETHSLSTLLHPESGHQQAALYETARTGSVGVRLRTHANHVSRLERMQFWHALPKLIERELASKNLQKILELSQYGTSFANIFYFDIVTFFTCLLAHACEGDEAIVKRLLPLSKIFRSNIPVGLSPKRHRHDALTWHVFVA